MQFKKETDAREYLLLKRLQAKMMMENSFYEFVISSFYILNPNETLLNNWHIKFICDVLHAEIERLIRGEPKEQDIIINVPPRSLKSFIVSVCLPAWTWIKKPSLKFIGSSYSDSLSTELNLLNRRLIQSEIYQDFWGDKIKLSGDQNLKTYFENTDGGIRRCTSTGGSITGSGADVIMVDDPQNPKMAFSDAERKTSIDFFNFTLSTRLNNPSVGLFIIIMQRLHEEDLSGHLLEKNPSYYQHINLPAELSDDVKPEKVREFYDAEGLFFPKRFTRDFLGRIKAQLGSYQYAGQFLQRSSPAEGGILKREHFKPYDKSMVTIFDRKILSIDCTFKDADESDFVVIQCWGTVGANKYLIKQYRGKWGFQKTLEMVLLARDEYQPNGIYIEDKANGTAIIEVLKKTVSGVIPVTPHESKFARAMAIQPQLEAGNIFVPINEPFVDAFIEECINFPNAKHDDCVDGFSQAITVLSRHISVGIVRF